MPAPAGVARAVIVYAYLLILTTLMGQRELGCCSALDLIASVILGAVGAATLADPGLALSPAFVTLAVIGGLETSAALLSHKFPAVRSVPEGHPTQLVRGGQILGKQASRPLQPKRPALPAQAERH